MAAHRQLLALALTLSPGVAGCARSADTDGPSGATEGTTDTEGSDSADLQVCAELPEAAAANWSAGPAVDPTGTSDDTRIAAAGRQTWDVAVDLLRATDPSVAPTFAVSPAAMAFALGLTYGRYQADPCGDRILDVVGYPEQGDALHNTLGASILALRNRALPSQEEPPLDPVVLSLESSTWSLNGAGGPGISDLYGARTHDVAGGSLPAINAVMNCVIEQQSQGLLVDFIPESLPAPDTAAFDVDVMYLRAPWETQLAMLPPGAFTRDDGAVVDVDRIGAYPYVAAVFQSDTLTSLTLAFRGGALSMMLVLPSAGTSIADFVDTLDPSALLSARDGAMSRVVDFSLPQMDIDAEVIDYYEPLGFECPEFTLRTVLQGAALKVDDKGIEAAAAAVDESWDTGGEPEPEVSIHFDRPFLFFVYDEPSEYVLFSGRYDGPQ